jgi:hypothetical protein
MISADPRPTDRMLKKLVATSMAVAALAGAGCAPPIQNGGVFVLPGATERLIFAMRMGYQGVGEAKPSAEVRQATSNEDLAAGTGASGKVGDYVLENGSVVAIVAAIDGTDRGGTLVDFARNPSRADDLGGLATSVLGHRVRYTSLKTGTDQATGAAFVEVSGTSGAIVVSTRYDLAPELDALLVHTSFTRPHPDDAAASGFDVEDSVSLAPGSAAHFEPAAGSLAAYGAQASYVVVPLVESDPTTPPGVDVATEPPSDSSEVIGLRAGRAPEGAFVYSRFVSPLERSDSLALEAALAVASGRETGDVEIEVAPEKWVAGLAIHPGKLVFRAGGRTAEVDVTQPIRAGDRVTVKVPSGAWDVAFAGDDFRSRSPAKLVVRPRQLNDLRVPTERVPTPAAMPIETASAPPAPPP